MFELISVRILFPFTYLIKSKSKLNSNSINTVRVLIDIDIVFQRRIGTSSYKTG